MIQRIQPTPWIPWDAMDLPRFHGQFKGFQGHLGPLSTLAKSPWFFQYSNGLMSIMTWMSWGTHDLGNLHMLTLPLLDVLIPSHVLSLSLSLCVCPCICCRALIKMAPCNAWKIYENLPTTVIYTSKRRPDMSEIER